MTTRIAITSSLFLGLAMLLIPSAQAMSPPPLHQSDGISTEARYRGVARGYGGYRHYGYGHRRYGYSGYRHYGYNYGYRAYGNYGYRHYGYSHGYRPYGYRPYGYGVARGIARRNIRRGVLR